MNSNDQYSPVGACRICGASEWLGTCEARSIVNQEVGHFAECASCGTLSVVEAVDYESLYSTRDSTNYSDSSGGPVFRLKVALFGFEVRRRLGHIPKDRPILDYGCGSGEFSAAILGAGYKCVFASDVQQDRPAALPAAVAYVPIDGLHSAGLFGAIVVRHVLEHVTNPRAVVSTLSAMLDVDGSLMLEVPNKQSFFRRVFRSRWSGYFFPYHVFVFGRQALLVLAELSGLEVRSLTEVNSPTLGVTCMLFGAPKNFARLVSMAFYPLQILLGFVSGRESVRIELVRR